jgi:hypothetical protein
LQVTQAQRRKLSRGPFHWQNANPLGSGSAPFPVLSFPQWQRSPWRCDHDM